jgi:hypothetical protein
MTDIDHSPDGLHEDAQSVKLGHDMARRHHEELEKLGPLAQLAYAQAARDHEAVKTDSSEHWRLQQLVNVAYEAVKRSGLVPVARELGLIPAPVNRMAK